MRDLTKKETEQYLRIVRTGNMDDMFDFGYLLGEIDTLKKQSNMIDKMSPNKTLWDEQQKNRF